MPDQPEMQSPAGPCARFVRFGFAGALGTAVHYTVLIVAVHVLAAPAAVAAMVGAAVGAVFNYLLARSYVFQSQRYHREAMPRFMVMVAVGIALNGALIGLLVGLGWNYLVAQVVTTAIIMGLNFGVSSIWIFKTASRSGTPPSRSDEP